MRHNCPPGHDHSEPNSLMIPKPPVGARKYHCGRSPLADELRAYQAQPAADYTGAKYDFSTWTFGTKDDANAMKIRACVLCFHRLKRHWIKICVAAAALFSVGGCATPAPHSPAPYTRVDDATELRIEDRPGGFRIFVNRSHYQFFPDQAELRHACRTAVTSIVPRPRRPARAPTTADQPRPHPCGYRAQPVDGRHLLLCQRNVEYESFDLNALDA
jgi:hypothetical protein